MAMSIAWPMSLIVYSACVVLSLQLAVSAAQSQRSRRSPDLTGDDSVIERRTFPCMWNIDPGTSGEIAELLKPHMPGKRLKCYGYSPLSRAQVTAGTTMLSVALMPLYGPTSEAAKPDECTNPRFHLMVQLVEAMKLLLEDALQNSSLLAQTLHGVEIHDSCGLAVATYDGAMRMIGRYSTEAKTLCNEKRRSELATGVVNPQAQCSLDTGPPHIGALIGPGLSKGVDAATSALSVYQVPHISYWATSDEFIDKFDFPYLFRTASTDQHAAVAITDILRHYGWHYVALLRGRDPAARADAADTFRAVISKHPICLAMDERFTRQDKEKIRFIIRRLVLGADDSPFNTPTVVVCIGGYLYVKEIFAEMKKMAAESSVFQAQLSRKHLVWIASDGWLGSAPRILPPPNLCQDVQNRSECLGHHTVIGPLFRVPQVFIEDARNFARRLHTHLGSLHVTEESVVKNPWLAIAWQKYFNCCLDFWGEVPNCRSCDTSKSVGDVFGSPVMPPISSGSLWIAVQAAFRMFENIAADIVRRNLMNEFPSGRALRQLIQNITLACRDGKGRSATCQVFHARQEIAPSYSINAVVAQNDGVWHLLEIGNWEASDTGAAEGYISITWNKTKPAGLHLWANGSPETPTSTCSEPCSGGRVQTQSYNGNQIHYNLARCCWICVVCPARQYSTGDACQPCADGFTANRNQSQCVRLEKYVYTFSSTPAIVILTLTGVGVMSTIITAVILIAWRASPIVKMANCQLSMVTLLFVFLGKSSTILIFTEPNIRNCSVSFVVVTSIFLTSIFTILIRYLRVISSSRLYRSIGPKLRARSRRVAKTFAKQMKLLVVLSSGLLLLLILVVIIEPVKAHEREVAMASQVELHRYCRVWLFYTVPACMLSLAILFGLLFLAYAIRRLKLSLLEHRGTVHSEAVLLGYLTIVLCILNSSLVLGASLTDEVVRRIMFAILINIHNDAILTILFFPRIYAIFFSTPGTPRDFASEADMRYARPRSLVTLNSPDWERRQWSFNQASTGSPLGVCKELGDSLESIDFRDNGHSASSTRAKKALRKTSSISVDLLSRRAQSPLKRPTQRRASSFTTPARLPAAESPITLGHHDANGKVLPAVTLSTDSPFASSAQSNDYLLFEYSL